MHSWIEQVLKRVGLYDPVDKNELLNASTEDAARSYESRVSEACEVTQERTHGNEALRRTLQDARLRTNSFVEFEQSIRRRRRNGNGSV